MRTIKCILLASLLASTAAMASINAGQKLQINFSNGWYPGTPGDAASMYNWNYYIAANTNFNTTTSNATDMVDSDGNTVSNVSLTATGWNGENWNGGQLWPGDGTDGIFYDQFVNFWWAFDSATEAITIHGLDTNLYYNVSVYALNPNGVGGGSQTEITLNGDLIDGGRQGNRWNSGGTPFKWKGMAASAAGELALSWNSTDPDNPVLNAIVIEAVDSPIPPPPTPISVGQTLKINFSNGWWPGTPTPIADPFTALNWNYYPYHNTSTNVTTGDTTNMVDFAGNIVPGVYLTTAGWGGGDWNGGTAWPGEPGADGDNVWWDQYVNFWWAFDSSTEDITIHGLDTNLLYNVRLYALFPEASGVGTDMEVTLNGSLIDGGFRGDRWNAAVTPFNWTNITASASGELSFSWNATGPDNPVVNAIVVDVIAPAAPIPEISDIAIAALPGTNAVTITWATGDGFSYVLLDRADLVLGDWATNATRSGTGGNVTVTDAVDQATTFYKVEGE